MMARWTRIFVAVAAAAFTQAPARCADAAENISPRGPSALAVSPDGGSLFVACADAGCVVVVDLDRDRVEGCIDVPARPTGLALGPGGRVLFVTCAAPQSHVLAIDTATRGRLWTGAAGHTAMAPVVTPDGDRLFVCNRFDNDVSVIDSHTGRQLSRVPVTREPVAAAVTPDGRTLVVANHLPLEPSTFRNGSATVTLVDTASLATTSVALPDGATNLKDVCVTPDGRYAIVTHILGNIDLVASHLDQGWMTTNSLSFVDLAGRRFAGNLLLDDLFQGAANPWGIAIAGDGAAICVTHAGTHELSVIDLAGSLPDEPHWWVSRGPMGGRSPVTQLRRRIPLPGRGPRDLVVADSKVYVAEYFSDTLAVVDLEETRSNFTNVAALAGVRSDGGKIRVLANAATSGPRLEKSSPEEAPPVTIPLGPPPSMSIVRRGEMLFHDAGHCFERWQSCASCHPDARADGLNWDLLNDGVGNPRNTKSMLLAHRTPPAMITGVRASAEVAVRSGMKHILFADESEHDAAAIDAYLDSLRPVPSPRLTADGRLSEAARRGRQLFESRQVGCAKCHPAPLYTDLKLHKVYPAGAYQHERLDTPTLVEVWRTSPYLHDGRYTTVRELLVDGHHGRTRGGVERLSDGELDDLLEFVLSL